VSSFDKHIILLLRGVNYYSKSVITSIPALFSNTKARNFESRDFDKSVVDQNVFFSSKAALTRSILPRVFELRF
jgi:hypothetical protein